jgi:hypothetical protein
LEERYSTKKADGRDVAIVYAGLNDRDKAFGWLEKAFGDRSFFLTALNIDPLLEPLHDDPRWSDLKQRVGLR